MSVKARLLTGKDYVKQVETPIGEFSIRPLTIGEIAQIQSCSMRGVKGQGMAESPTIELELGQITRNNSDAEAMLLAYGLSCNGERFTPNDIKLIPASKEGRETLEILKREILNLSGVREEELLPFCQVARGEGASSVDTTRDETSG